MEDSTRSVWKSSVAVCTDVQLTSIRIVDMDWTTLRAANLTIPAETVENLKRIARDAVECDVQVIVY